MQVMFSDAEKRHGQTVSNRDEQKKVNEADTIGAKTFDLRINEFTPSHWI